MTRSEQLDHVLPVKHVLEDERGHGGGVDAVDADQPVDVVRVGVEIACRINKRFVAENERCRRWIAGATCADKGETSEENSCLPLHVDLCSRSWLTFLDYEKSIVDDQGKLSDLHTRLRNVRRLRGLERAARQA